jgi:hypothetical protein
LRVKCVWLAVVGLVLAGCASAIDVGPTAPAISAPQKGKAILLATVAASVAPSQPATALSTAEPVTWVILHTNDNWGETEPCG